MKLIKTKINYFEIMKKFFIGVIIFIVFYFLAVLSRKFFSYTREKNKNEKIKKVSKTLIFEFISDFIYSGLLLVGILTVLVYFGLNLNTILVIIGSAGLAIALALKDFLTQIVAGVVIIFRGFYKIGDLVKIDNTEGYIHDFDLLNTSLKEFTGVITIIPNNQIIDGIFSNYSKYDTIWMWAIICVSNSKKNLNFKDIINGLKEELKTSKYVVNGETGARVSSFDEQGTKVLGAMRINVKDYTKARREIYLKMREYFSKKNILLCDYNCLDFLE